VIDLHCAGLKVGEVMAKARLCGKSVEETKILALKYSPAQDFNLKYPDLKCLTHCERVKR
jgi:hypothetical protein